MPTKKKVQPTKPVHELVEQKQTSSRRNILIPVLVGAIIVASFVVGFLYGKVSVYEKLDLKQKAAAEPSPQAQETAAPVTLDQVKALFADSKNITFGDPQSKVLFVEFSDPSCPYCHVASGDNPELNKQIGDRFVMVKDGGTYVAPVQEIRKLVNQNKVAFAWVYSPGHGNGELGTQALYCAKEQNKFWEVHDLLMSNKGYDMLNTTVKNDPKNIPQLVDFLKGAVKANEMKSCLESGKFAGRIQTDTALSRQFGVQGTPSFFVNETNFPGAYSYKDMESAVAALLK